MRVVTISIIQERSCEAFSGTTFKCGLEIVMENGDALCLRAFKHGEEETFNAIGFMRFTDKGKQYVPFRDFTKNYRSVFDLTEEDLRTTIKQFIVAHNEEVNRQRQKT